MKIRFADPQRWMVLPTLALLLGATVALCSYSVYTSQEIDIASAEVEARTSALNLRRLRARLPRADEDRVLVRGQLVRSEDAVPCPSGRVEVLNTDGSVDAAAANADGTFSLQATRGTVLVADAARRARARREIPSTGDQLDLGVIALAPGAAVRIHVSLADDTTSVPGSRVEVRPNPRYEERLASLRGLAEEQPKPAEGSALADTAGAADIPGIAVGSWRVDATSPDGLHQGSAVVDITGPADSVPVRVRLQPRVPLVGRVALDPSRRAVKIVLVEAARCLHPDGPTAVVAQVDASGEFRAATTGKGMHFARVRFSDGSESAWQRIEVAESAVVVAAGGAAPALGDGSIAGRVVDSQGAPLPGSNVRAHLDIQGWIGPRVASVPTDPDGCFEFSDLHDERYALVADLSALGGSLARCACEPMSDVAPGTDGIVLQIPTGHLIVGRVVDERQRPVRGAILAAVSLDDRPAQENSPWPRIASTTTDATGAFVVPQLAVDNYRLELRSGGFGPQLKLTGGERVHTDEPSRTFVAVRGAVITGFVRGITRHNMSGAGVSAIPVGSNDDPVRADVFEDGRFELTGLDPNVRYAIGASTRWYASAVVEATAGDSGVELILPEPVVTEGTVLFADGRPYSDNVVFLTEIKTRRLRRARTDGRGGFRVEGLTGEQYTASLEHVDSSTGVRHREDVGSLGPGDRGLVLRAKHGQPPPVAPGQSDR